MYTLSEYVYIMDKMRIIHGITYKKMADYTGVTLATLLGYRKGRGVVKGKRKIQQNTLKKIHNGLTKLAEEEFGMTLEEYMELPLR